MQHLIPRMVLVAVTLVSLVAGVVLLAFAADQFVLGAARVALIRRVSPLLVGVVIIGFGTSCPEMLVSTLAAANGQAEIAIGNIVGSNIANVSLLLGIGALIVPISVSSLTVRREAPLTVGAVLAFALVLQGGGIARWEAVVLVGLLAFAMWSVSRSSDADPLGPEAEELADVEHHSLSIEVVRTVLGLIGTIAGAQLLLSGAVDVADRAGLSEGFVGATLVAVGTSLPELVTVVQSARRRETDLIVGNLLGSNLFNSLAVGSLVGFVDGNGVEGDRLTIVGPLLAIGVAALAWVAMVTQRTVRRWEGIVLIAAYAAIVPLLA